MISSWTLVTAAYAVHDPVRHDVAHSSARIIIEPISGLVQDCGNSSALALELPQSCTKPSLSQIQKLQKTITLSP